MLPCLLTACDRATPTAAPIGVPPAAVLLISAPTLADLRRMSTYIEPLIAPTAADEAQPAWFACEPKICVLRRGGPTTPGEREGVWSVADGPGSLMVWGAADRPTLDAALLRWRKGKPAPAGWAGFAEPRVMLERWKPTKPRAKELVEAATFQASRIDFTMKVSGDVVDAELRMRPTPGEPSFIDGLGSPTGPLPDLSGLIGESPLTLARLSADPELAWALFRGTLGAEQRGELDALVAKLRDDFALDFETQVLAALTGHAVIVVYDLDPKHATLSDLVTLTTTSEAIVFPVRDRGLLRRTMGAWTQLSKGRLQLQSTGDDEADWVWFEDDEIRWSAILGPDTLTIVDSPIALDHLKSWSKAPTPLTPTLTKRGVDTLLTTPDRSGVYLDIAALRAALPALAATLPPGIKSIAASADPHENGELVRIRLIVDP